MESTFELFYSRPGTKMAGCAMLRSEEEVAKEKARLEARGYVVTKVLRPARPVPPAADCGS
jgi:hypothetical protein